MAEAEIRERPRDEAGVYVFDLSLPVSRVLWRDIGPGKWRDWLLKRLGEKWPHIGTMNFAAHARSWAETNEYLFLKCGRTVALAVAWREPLIPEPIVREVFLFTEDKTNQHWRREAIRLYREMQIWAATQNASSVSIGHCSDMTRSRLIGDGGAEEVVELHLEPRRQ